MEEKTLAYAGYWRNSLADAGLGRGGMSRADVNGFLPVAAEEMTLGVVSRDVVDAFFSGEEERTRTVDVVFRPRVYVARVEHGNQQNNGVPQIVTPLVTPAVLARDGRLYPSQSTVVPRDLLEPLERGSYAIGTVAALDSFLTTDVVPGIEFVAREARDVDPADFQTGWNNYREACGRLLEKVCPGQLADEDDLEAASYGYLTKKASASGASKHILALYDHLRSHPPSAPLFDRFASEVVDPIEPCLPTTANFAARLGHASDAYSLAEAQRDALNHLLASRDGEILALNGPPGTGKTTLLLSVVASWWAKAALEKGEPPIILATSSLNQAVTNILDAFGQHFATGKGAFAGRWLPDVTSFGAFFAAKKQEKKEEGGAGNYQTRSFFDKVESPGYTAAAEKHYLQAGAAAFPDLEQPSVESIVGRLHRCIVEEARKLSTIDAAWKRLAEARNAVRAELGDDPATAQEERLRRGRLLQGEKHACDELAQRWEDYLAQESIFYSLFAWLPPVHRKRLRLARVFLKQAWSSELPRPDWRSVEQIETSIEALVIQCNDALHQQQLLIQRGESVLQAELERLQHWKVALEPLPGANDEPSPTLAKIDDLADRLIRFPIFLLTTHYWEGRWLLDAQALLKVIDTEKSKTGRVAVEKRWQRRMKLTPCIVSTFFMLPAEMEVSRYDGGDFVSDYLYNWVDLLIVDEAGQALPEVAGASFALSKRALVIGDTLQLEPIWSIPARVDIGNLLDAKLVPENGYKRAYERLSELGKTVSAGSVMRIAQCATRYHYDLDLARGLFLRQHKRSFDEIIEYCNKLCYHGNLRPERGPKAAEATRADGEYDELPAMGYLHIDGICEPSRDGSRHNLLEAEVIAAWLAERKHRLEATYRKPLNEIVGVITPFAAQVRAITQACRKLNIEAGPRRGQMTVGTVHSLQGAERRVVIFSPVYSKHADGGFIDRSVSMLNVAVSRAKNTFLVFGDMDTFELVPRHTPRGQLAVLLFDDDANELNFPYRPRHDLAARTGVSQLRDAHEHDAFLLNVLATAAREVHIVTPWIRLERIEQTGALGAMAAAALRGIKVCVYTDLDANTKDRDSAIVVRKHRELQAVAQELTARKVDTVLVWRVHSKIVIGDENVYCVGSFNWFSAIRGEGALHETSLVYRGPDLLDEIEVMKESLRRKVAGLNK